MELKRRITLTIVVIYIILLITFFVCEKVQYNDIVEHYGKTKCAEYMCINFCPSSEKYSNATLNEGLRNISAYNSDFFRHPQNSNFSYVIVRNQLKCHDFELKVIAEDLKGVRMSSVSENY